MSDKRVGSMVLFPTDEPVAPADMIGRERDVVEIAESLTGGGNVVLAGPRRTGKTTVADAALAACKRRRCYLARVDLFYLADVGDFAEALALSALSNRPVLRRAIAAATRRGRTVLDALSTTVTYRARQDLGEDVEIAIDLGRRSRDPQRALRTAFELPQRIASADRRRIVVFLDEFQEITSGLFGEPKVITQQLRAVLQRSPDVSVLFAGSMEHLMRDLFSPADRALSQFGAFHELEPIADEQWSKGIRSRLKLDDCSIADSALQRLVATGEGHPRATMLIAQQTHLEAVKEGAHAIDDALVVTGLAGAMRADRLKHEQTLERIRLLSRHAQTLAQRVARGAGLYEGLAPASARRALDRLLNAGVVVRTSRHGGWAIADPLLRKYLEILPGGGV